MGPRTVIALVVFATIPTGLTPVHASTVTRRPSVGLAASVHGEQVDILVPMRVGDVVVISPGFGFAHIGDIGTDWTLGIAARFNLRQGRVLPYLTARAGVLIYSPSNGDGLSDVVFGPGFGGECFIDSHLSVAVEAQLNWALSGEGSYRFGNPGGTNVNSATAIVVTVYF